MVALKRAGLKKKKDSWSSVACGVTFHFDHTWDDLPEVANVSRALGGCDRQPELLYATDQLLFVVWFDVPSQKFLEFMPQILYWIEIWRLRRGLPPVDVVGVEKLHRPL